MLFYFILMTTHFVPVTRPLSGYLYKFYNYGMMMVDWPKRNRSSSR